MSNIIIEYLGNNCIICNEILLDRKQGCLCDLCNYKMVGFEMFSGETAGIERISCPKCGEINESTAWEFNTANHQPLDLIGPPRIKIPKEIHHIFDSAYRCPFCHCYVNGSELIRDVN